jgi:hypothetical protein
MGGVAQAAMGRMVGFCHRMVGFDQEKHAHLALKNVFFPAEIAQLLGFWHVLPQEPHNLTPKKCSLEMLFSIWSNCPAGVDKSR